MSYVVRFALTPTGPGEGTHADINSEVHFPNGRARAASRVSKRWFFHYGQVLFRQLEALRIRSQISYPYSDVLQPPPEPNNHHQFWHHDFQPGVSRCPVEDVVKTRLLGPFTVTQHCPRLAWCRFQGKAGNSEWHDVGMPAFIGGVGYWQGLV